MTSGSSALRRGAAKVLGILAVAGCKGAPPAALAPPPPEDPEALIAAVAAAGACAEDDVDAPSGIRALAAPDGALYEVECEMWAYQGPHEYWSRDGSGGWVGVEGPSGTVTRAIGIPGFDPDTGRLSWLQRARGLGDCGEWWILQLEGSGSERRFSLVEHRARECDDAPDPPPPQQWPLVMDPG